MNPAFDFLSYIGNDWLWGSPLKIESSFDNMLLLLVIPVLVSYALRQCGTTRLRLPYVVASLFCLSLWQLSCVQLEAVEKAAAARQGADPGCYTPGCVPVTVARGPKAAPSPAAQGLPVPTFSPQTGTVAFGTKINLSVSALPSGAVIEYSYDNGKTWIPGDKVAVIGPEPILSRTRINDLTSNPAQAAFKPFYRRMMVIGNSIMSHGPLPAEGWFKNNGMAATAPEKDFVHVLTSYLAEQDPAVVFRLVSGGEFERHFSQPEYSFDEFNEPLQQFKPDLIVVRLGENVNEGNVFSPIGFEAQFRRLLEWLATRSGQPVRIVCTTSVWRRPRADIVIRRVTSEKGIPLADLSSMVDQDQYFAIGQYTNPSVAAHPNDAGMKRIADLIWQKLP